MNKNKIENTTAIPKTEDEEFDNHIRSSVLSTTIGGGGIHRLFGFGIGVRYFYRSTKRGGAEHAKGS